MGMEPKQSNIKITCLAAASSEAFQPPLTLDISGHKLTLREMGRAIGYDKDQKVWFRFEPSGSVETAEVAEKALAHLQTKTKPCKFSGCTNHVLDGEKCWVEHREPGIETRIEIIPYKPDGTESKHH